MPDPAPGDPLTDRLTDALDAGLRLGASLARRLADVTGSATTAERGRAPVDDIVRYGSQAAGNLIGLVAAGARSGLDLGGRVARTADGARQTTGAAPGGPVVSAGSTLRVPLLVENTGQVPTRTLTFTTTSLLRTGCEDAAACTCIPAGAVHFDPESLVVAAHDFEKLTVRVAVPGEAPPGGYTAEIAGGDGWFTTTLRWSVLAAP